MRGWKNIFHANGDQKKFGVTILISDKIDLKRKNNTRDKEGHYIIIKASIQEKDITSWMVKNPPAMKETWVQFLGWEDPLEKRMATHSSMLRYT